MTQLLFLAYAKFKRSKLAALPLARRIEIRTPYRLQPGIGISGAIPRNAPFEDTSGPFFFYTQKQQPDPIIDDQSMWFETTDGLVILTGCCHAVLINTVTHIRAVSNTHRICGGIIPASPENWSAGGIPASLLRQNEIEERNTLAKQKAP